MPSKITLDTAEPGIAEVVASAAVGEPLTLRNVTIVPTSVSDAMIEADIAEITVDDIPSVEEGAVETMDDGGVPVGMPTTNTGGFDEGGM